MSEDTRRATRSEEEGSAQPERFKNRRAGAQRTGSTVSRAAARAAQHSDKNLQPAPEGASEAARPGAAEAGSPSVCGCETREPGRFGVALDRQMRVRDRKPGRSGVAHRDEVDRVRKPPRRKGGLPFCLGRGGGGGDAASPGGLEWGLTRGEGGTPAIIGKGGGEAASPGDLVRG